MSQGSADRSMIPPAAVGRDRYRPTWLRLYFALAAFDVLIVCVSLYLNHQISAIYSVSVEVNQSWADRLANYDRLRILAGAVNAPGNDVFDTHDVAGETARLLRAQAVFERELKAARDELSRDASLESRSSLLREMGDIETSVAAMTAEADLIFSYFSRGDATRAGSRMATMDRKYASVNAALARLNATVYRIQRQLFEEQQRQARQLSRLEYVIAGAVLLMVLGAIFYGYRVGQHVEQVSSERARFIRELEAAGLRAEAASRAKSGFISSMSHELRTPLNAVLGFAQLLASDPDLPPAQRDDAGEIVRGGQQLLALIRDVLDLAAIESGSMNPALQPVAVASLAARSFELVAAAAHAAMVELTDAGGDGRDAVIQADPARLLQVMQQLLGNAIKFNHPQGSVRLACTLNDAQPHGAVRITISDTGVGIAADKQSRVFTPFDRLGHENGTIRGTGIGLVIVRRMVEAMGGALGFDSVEGEGSSFWVEFPVLADPA